MTLTSEVDLDADPSPMMGICLATMPSAHTLLICDIYICIVRLRKSFLLPQWEYASPLLLSLHLCINMWLYIYSKIRKLTVFSYDEAHVTTS